MRRGEICLVEFEPVRGSEANRTRPAVVVSNDGANAAARSGRGVVTVVPVTSNVTRVYPFQMLIAARWSGLQQNSKAQAEQVRAVAVERVGRRIGAVPPERMPALDAALRVHLAL